MEDENYEQVKISNEDLRKAIREQEAQGIPKMKVEFTTEPKEYVREDDTEEIEKVVEDIETLLKL